MTHKIRIPLKYKFLGVLLSITFLGFVSFFYFAHKTFSEDKKLFVMELNLSSLKATMSEIKLELRGRMDELQIFVPRVYQTRSVLNGENSADPYQGLSGRLQEEVLGVTFLRKNADGKLATAKQYFNKDLSKNRNFSSHLLSDIEKAHPLPVKSLDLDKGMELMNRSIRVDVAGTQTEVPVMTILFDGNFIGDESKDVIVAVDLLQDFMRKKLKESEMAEVFLISKNGTLLSHPDLGSLVDYSTEAFNHPIVPRLKEKQFPRESLELEVGNEAYLCNVSESGFDGVFAVSQVKKSQAFVALQVLLRQTVLIGLVILSLALVFSILFASGLTKNIQKLKEAAEHIGKGTWDIKLDIKSNDEVQNVAESFNWMSNRLTELMKETVEKARMEKELDTARLVQSTLLANENIPSTMYDLLPFYKPASECGGDFWDSYLCGNKLTLVIADATGHGAGAAIVTAIAKSSFSTLNKINPDRVLTPERFLTTLNSIIHSLCKEQLLMTMCVVQLDLETGMLEVCSAGHESPFLLKKATDGGKGELEVLFNRGERLGHSPTSVYTSDFYQINQGDSLLLFTDGVSEAKDLSGKEFGERALKKVFSTGGQRPLTQMRDEIMAKATSHTVGTPQEDDITFVLFSWTNPYKQSAGKPKAA